MKNLYPDAPSSLRWGRLLSTNVELLRRIPDGGIAEFDHQLKNHLSGLKIRSEVQAGALRLYLLYCEVESLLGRSGSFNSFASSIGETNTKTFNYLRGSSGRSRYTSDQLHGWCCLLTRKRLLDGFQVHVILHPTGVVEPVVSEIDGGTDDSSGSR